jgi:hypothetical protein
MTLENVHPAEIIQLELQKKEACAEAGIEYQRDHIAEQRILQDPENALLYARTVLNGRWPELEEMLVQMPVDLDDMNDFSNEVWDYVLNVANRPIPALEKHFLHNPEIANFYQVWSQGNRGSDAESTLGFTTVELARSRDGRLISEFDEFWPGVPPRELQLTAPIRVRDFEEYIGQRRNAHLTKLGLPTEAPMQSHWNPSGGTPSSPPPSPPTLELTPDTTRPTLKDVFKNRIDGYRAEHPVEVEKQEIRWKKQQLSATLDKDETKDLDDDQGPSLGM